MMAVGPKACQSSVKGETESQAASTRKTTPKKTQTPGPGHNGAWLPFIPRLCQHQLFATIRRPTTTCIGSSSWGLATPRNPRKPALSDAAAETHARRVPNALQNEKKVAGVGAPASSRQAYACSDKLEAVQYGEFARDASGLNMNAV